MVKVQINMILEINMLKLKNKKNKKNGIKL